MRRCLMILICGLLAAGGCSGSHHAAPARHAFGPGPAPVRMASSTLFDRVPGRYNATDFASRSDWPSTDAYYQGGQMVFFTEHFYDLQGPNQNPDATYRQFDTYRSGFGYR